MQWKIFVFTLEKITRKLWIPRKLDGRPRQPLMFPAEHNPDEAADLHSDSDTGENLQQFAVAHLLVLASVAIAHRLPRQQPLATFLLCHAHVSILRFESQIAGVAALPTLAAEAFEYRTHSGASV